MPAGRWLVPPAAALFNAMTQTATYVYVSSAESREISVLRLEARFRLIAESALLDVDVMPRAGPPSLAGRGLAASSGPAVLTAAAPSGPIILERSVQNGRSSEGHVSPAGPQAGARPPREPVRQRARRLPRVPGPQRLPLRLVMLGVLG
ncbi:hypothetical protein WME91_37885 [Sorangium sp. So ce269]